MEYVIGILLLVSFVGMAILLISGIAFGKYCTM